MTRLHHVQEKSKTILVLSRCDGVVEPEPVSSYGRDELC